MCCPSLITKLPWPHNMTLHLSRFETHLACNNCLIAFGKKHYIWLLNQGQVQIIWCFWFFLIIFIYDGTISIPLHQLIGMHLVFGENFLLSNRYIIGSTIVLSDVVWAIFFFFLKDIFSHFTSREVKNSLKLCTLIRKLLLTISWSV